jgi:hypothetical protein
MPHPVARSPDRWTPNSSGATPIHPTYIAVVLRHSYLIAGTPAEKRKTTLTQEITNMTTTINRTLARYIALPIVSAGIIGGAALGLAGAANAAPTVPSHTTVHATPAAPIAPGAQAHRAHHHNHAG